MKYLLLSTQHLRPGHNFTNFFPLPNPARKNGILQRSWLHFYPGAPIYDEFFLSPRIDCLDCPVANICWSWISCIHNVAWLFINQKITHAEKFDEKNILYFDLEQLNSIDHPRQIKIQPPACKH